MGPLSHLWKKQCLSITTVRSFWCIAHTTAIWELEVFWRRPSWKTTELQLQPGPLEIFRGSSNWKATESQLQSGNTRGGRSWKATGPQLQSGNSRFWWQVQLKTTMLQLQSGNSRFWWQALFEGDGAITAIWEF